MQIIKKNIEAIKNSVQLEVEVDGAMVKVLVCTKDGGGLATHGNRKLSLDKKHEEKEATGKLVMSPYSSDKQALQVVAAENNTPGLHAEATQRDQPLSFIHRYIVKLGEECRNRQPGAPFSIHMRAIQALQP